MKIYPVEYASDDPGASINKVRVRPFTSVIAARKFLADLNSKDGISSTMLDPEEFTLNKDGVVSAFERGQRLLLAAEFLEGK